MAMARVSIKRMKSHGSHCGGEGLDSEFPITKRSEERKMVSRCRNVS